MKENVTKNTHRGKLIQARFHIWQLATENTGLSPNKKCSKGNLKKMADFLNEAVFLNLCVECKRKRREGERQW